MTAEEAKKVPPAALHGPRCVNGALWLKAVSIMGATRLPQGSFMGATPSLRVHTHLSLDGIQTPKVDGHSLRECTCGGMRGRQSHSEERCADRS